MATVVLTDVRKVYDSGKVAIEGANVTVDDGELLVLVGPSGCGKSTLLRSIAGLESIDSGTIEIDGKQINHLPSRERDIAMVFQSYALYPHMTVAENLAFGLKLRKFPKDEIDRKVQDVAVMLELDHLLKNKPKQLSGGQRQRVALGRALIREPKVFLLDEPLSNLDAKLRVAMRVEIAKLHNRLGATMIYVTHDQVEAMTLGNRVVVLKDGVVQQIDKPMNLYDKPANLFVAGFIGSPSMNFFRGHLTGNELKMHDRSLQLVGLEESGLPLAAMRDRDIVLGLRPEHLRPVAPDETPSDQPRLQAELEVMEPIGNEVFLNLRMNDMQLVSRIPPELAPSGDARGVELAFDTARLHVFDAEDGARIN